MFTLPLKNAEGNFTKGMQILEHTPQNNTYRAQMGKGMGQHSGLQPG